MIRAGVVGYGYWGPNLVRNLVEAPGVEAAWICDHSEDRLDQARARYPGVRTTNDVASLIDDSAVDAVLIATPVASHYPLALRALRAGKHVLVEKPIASSSAQAARLIEEADRRGLVLMVDHTFVYHPAVRKIRDLVHGGDLGDVYYFDSTRINLGIFQRDVNVLWDLAVHDLSILEHVIPDRPVAVSANGVSNLEGPGGENIAYLTLLFEGRRIAHIHVNWLAPVKVRRTLIGGSRRMIVYDDLEPSEKLKVYDKGVTVGNHPDRVYERLIGYRTGDMWAPKLETTEALRNEVEHFIHCIENGERPITDGEAGLRVVRILEAATRSLRRRGRAVELRAGVPFS